MSALLQIQHEVRLRVDEIATSHGNWPCRKGCDECCRRLASAPLVSLDEWKAIAGALDALPSDVADAARERIRDSVSATRPAICPLLDTGSGTCLVYEARPVACRAYGFYVDRQDVLGCSRIEAVGEQSPEIVWGNQASLEKRVDALGPAAYLAEWIGR
jgi:Fe-S-cluster containining protein